MARGKPRKARAHDGIPVGPRLVAALEVAWRARLPALLEGPTGIGKSEIVTQVAQKLGVSVIVLDLSLLEPPDLVGLPVIAEGRTSYATPAILPTAGAGILMLEELNRAERYIQQPALQLLTARTLHQYRLPDGWSTMAAINPEDGDYQVTPLDPAMRERFLQLQVHAHRATWLAWAETHGVHPAVLKLARAHDHLLDDTPPRTWTYVSNLLHSFQPAEILDAALMRDALGGYLSRPWVELLVKERDGGTLAPGIDPYALLLRYHHEERLQREVRSLHERGRLDLAEQTCHRLAAVVQGQELGVLIGRGAFSLESFEALLADLPGDLREKLQRAFGDNPLAGQLLDLQPTDVLEGYPNSPQSRRVAGWIRKKPHRARALATAVALHVAQSRDGMRMKRDNAFKVSVGHLLDQLGADHGAAVAFALKQRGVQPVLLARKRR